MKGILKAAVVGGIILAIGIVLLVIGLALNDWKFRENIKFEYSSFTAENPSAKLVADMDAGELKIERYDGDRIFIEYPVAKNFNTEISENDGVLYFKSPRRVWYKNFWHFYTLPLITIKIPQNSVIDLELDVDAGTAEIAAGAYGKIDVKMDAGTVKTGSLVCTDFNLDMDAGKADMEEISCSSLTADLDAGAADLKKVTAVSSNFKISAGSLNASFTGSESEYGISKKVSAGSTNLQEHAGTTDKTIYARISAGSLTVRFDS